MIPDKFCITHCKGIFKMRFNEIVSWTHFDLHLLLSYISVPRDNLTSMLFPLVIFIIFLVLFSIFLLLVRIK